MWSVRFGIRLYKVGLTVPERKLLQDVLGDDIFN